MTKYLTLLISLPIYFFRNFRRVTISLLIFLVSIGPRFNLGSLQYGKLFDIRAEDLLLIIVLLSWIISLLLIPKQKIVFSKLGTPIFLYLFASCISTFFGLVSGFIEPFRALFFLLKEVEYFLFFFITINIVNSLSVAKSAVWSFLISGILNGIYSFYQITTGQIGQGMEDPTNIYRHYGVSTLGEGDPAMVGIYFTLLVLFSLAVFLFLKHRIVRLVSFICIVLSISGLIGSFSRGSLWGAIIFIPIWLFLFFLAPRLQIRKLQAIAIVIIIVLVGGLFFLMSKNNPYAKRIVNTNHLLSLYYDQRVKEVYNEYFKIISINPIIGLGKSITGDQEVSATLYAGAHNQYIRLLAETGIVGLLAFLYILWSILKLSFVSYRNSPSRFIQCLGFSSLTCTAYLLIISFGQDAFIIAKIAEFFWIVVGLATWGQQWETSKSQ